MKLWLDDQRNPPDNSGEWKICRTGEEAIQFIMNVPEEIEHIAFDHDLGEGISGYEVAKFVEQMERQGAFQSLTYSIQSDNSVGIKNIKLALRYIREINLEELCTL